jgi:hypothetical protein
MGLSLLGSPYRYFFSLRRVGLGIIFCRAVVDLRAIFYAHNSKPRDIQQEGQSLLFWVKRSAPNLHTYLAWVCVIFSRAMIALTNHPQFLMFLR